MKSWTKNGLILAGVLITCTGFAAEKTAFVRASHIRGAKIMYQSGGEAGTIQDVALDPNTGCARFVMIQTGGHVIAAPFAVLHSSGEDTYTVTVDKERFMSAPVVNVDRVEEWSNPGFVQRVYSYYGESPSESNISINERGGHGHGERGAERGAAERGGGVRGQAERGPQRGHASPAPVGEQKPGASPSARAGASPQAQASPSARARSRAHGQSTPSERSATRAGTSASPSRESMPSQSPGQRSAHPGASPLSEHSPSGTQHRGGASSAERSPSAGTSPSSSQ